MHEVKANLGRVVRTARKRKGITQDHLGGRFQFGYFLFVLRLFQSANKIAKPKLATQ